MATFLASVWCVNHIRRYIPAPEVLACLRACAVGASPSGMAVDGPHKESTGASAVGRQES
jgi:hypothetical protein